MYMSSERQTAAGICGDRMEEGIKNFKKEEAVSLAATGSRAAMALRCMCINLPRSSKKPSQKKTVGITHLC